MMILVLACVCFVVNANAQRNSGRLSFGVGLLYENGMDMTLAYEHEMNYRHAWEFFSQWLYKMGRMRLMRPCLPGIFLAELSHLRLRRGLQALCGAWTQPLRQSAYRSFGREQYEKFLAGIHVGYEHNYVLRSGWTLYWQVKSDMMIKGADLLRTGVVLGVKLPIK